MISSSIIAAFARQDSSPYPCCGSEQEPQPSASSKKNSIMISSSFAAAFARQGSVPHPEELQPSASSKKYSTMGCPSVAEDSAIPCFSIVKAFSRQESVPWAEQEAEQPPALARHSKPLLVNERTENNQDSRIDYPLNPLPKNVENLRHGSDYYEYTISSPA